MPAENKPSDEDDPLSLEEQHEIEQERIDTFWAVFVLDRVISSGTGRPVTFRDGDFDLTLPEPSVDPVSGWPAPFPHFVTIIHLYGRVSDVLDKISSAEDLTDETMGTLAQMEYDLTCIYQQQDQRLNFSAQNFQEYVKAGQGTTFVLLHSWFHALIIVLHQPTLVMPFGSFPAHPAAAQQPRALHVERQDHLRHPRLRRANRPKELHRQPVCVAAHLHCRLRLPHGVGGQGLDPVVLGARAAAAAASSFATGRAIRAGSSGSAPAKHPRSAKHSLLTSSANQNYQRCYKSLQNLHDYWGEVKYILTALDQRSKGIWDCARRTPTRRSRAPSSRAAVASRASPTSWSSSSSRRPSRPTSCPWRGR